MIRRSLKGYLALSKAGRDKDRIYVILDNDEEYVYLTDGKYKKIEYPKKKKRKHIEIVFDADNRLPATLNNEIVKSIIKDYKSVRNK